MKFIELKHTKQAQTFLYPVTEIKCIETKELDANLYVTYFTKDGNVFNTILGDGKVTEMYCQEDIIDAYHVLLPYKSYKIIN